MLIISHLNNEDKNSEALLLKIFLRKKEKGKSFEMCNPKLTLKLGL
jgi:hypothetical protein